MNIALVHDWLTNFGGSERCVQAFSEIYPTSPIYTSVWNEKKVTQFSDKEVVTSFLQKFPFSKTHHAFYLNFMPLAFERFDFHDYDVVLTSSHACSKGIITSPRTLHVCYCHTPTRYLWDFWHKYINNPSYFGIFNFLIKAVGPFMATYLRLWDRAAAERVDYFIANSRFIAERIKKYYRKDVDVIYPPVEVKSFFVAEPEDYFLIVSRLVTYKQVELAVRAFNEIGLPLKVAGDGPEYKNLKALAKSNVEFLGEVSDDDKQNLMAHCRAFIFPPEEDFGITAVEAMAAGRPVIAYGRGGALETIVENKTGLFFPEQTSEELKKAILKFDKMSFDPQTIRKHALQFDREIFKNKIENYINDKIAQQNNNTYIRS